MNRTQRRLDDIRSIAGHIAAGMLTLTEARATFAGAHFDVLPNGRVYWFDRRTGLQGAEPA